MRKAGHMWAWTGLQEAIIQTFWFASPSETLADDTDIFHRLTTAMPIISFN